MLPQSQFAIQQGVKFVMFYNKKVFSPFHLKWREFISQPRSNITNLT